MQVLVLGAHYIKIFFYYGTPLGDIDNAITSGTRLDALAIGPNSSKVINIVALVCKSQDIFSRKKISGLEWELEMWLDSYSSPEILSLDKCCESKNFIYTTQEIFPKCTLVYISDSVPLR